MIVIYTPKVTNRIKYTLDFVFQQYFGIDYELTENADFTILSENCNINYSNKKIDNWFSVFQDDLLLQEDIRVQKLFVSFEYELPVFFQTTDHYNLKFDIFSAIFFLLSRYEEYLPHEKDVHERYKSSNSILANPAFNFSPIVEFWLDLFKKELLKIQPNLSFKKYEFEYLPTFDIDNAFQFLGRNWLKNPPNIFQKTCRKVLFKKEKDPYNNFDFILEELEKNKLRSIFFFLLNDDGKENSNVSPDSDLLQKVISGIEDSKIEIGIHSSYFATEKNLISVEKKFLENLTTSAITVSRQHFLKISFPNYFRELIKADIKIDHSLCYPDVVGFRAGCSRPFFFYDLETNKSTQLLLQPSCFMDATFEYYRKIKFNEMQAEFLTLFNQLKQINGILVPIFHNDLFAKNTFRSIFTIINKQVKEAVYEK